MDDLGLTGAGLEIDSLPAWVSACGSQEDLIRAVLLRKIQAGEPSTLCTCHLHVLITRGVTDAVLAAQTRQLLGQQQQTKDEERRRILASCGEI